VNLAVTVTMSAPNVLWSQTPKGIILKVQVSNADNIQVNFEKQSVFIKCTSRPQLPQLAGGPNDQLYETKLDLFKAIDPSKCVWKKTTSHVEVTMKKAEPAKSKDDKWTRLLKLTEKNHKVKVDWDAYEDSDDEEEKKKSALPQGLPPGFPGGLGGLGGGGGGGMDEPVDYDELFRNMGKKTNDAKNEAKWIYLLTFNILNFILWFIICIRLFYQFYYIYTGKLLLSDVYDQTGYIVIGAQVSGILEIINSILGLVRARPLPAFLLHAGRDIVLYLMWAYPPAQKDWGVIYLFLVWSLGDIIRYAYYFAETVSLQGLIAIFQKTKPYKLLRTVRYTAPLGLLPVGFFMELRILYCVYSYATLPPLGQNALVIYCCIAYLLGAPYLYYSMYKQRAKQEEKSKNTKKTK